MTNHPPIRVRGLVRWRASNKSLSPLVISLHTPKVTLGKSIYSPFCAPQKLCGRCARCTPRSRTCHQYVIVDSSDVHDLLILTELVSLASEFGRVHEVVPMIWKVAIILALGLALLLTLIWPYLRKRRGGKTGRYEIINLREELLRSRAKADGASLNHFGSDPAGHHGNHHGDSHDSCGGHGDGGDGAGSH